MTDKEIKKALECCINARCGGCPRLDNDMSSVVCMRDLTKHALDLINRQQAEIEKLSVELVGMRGACNSYKMHYDNAKVEIERLNKENENLLIRLCKKVNQESKAIEKLIKAEAIKEFAERLEEAICKIPQHHFTLAGVIWLIKKFVKEMVGEQE